MMPQNKVTVYQVRGTSMRPFIRGGDYVVVQRCPVHLVRPGDVVAVAAGVTGLCVHRLVWKTIGARESRLIMKGDSISDFGTIRLGPNGEFIGKVISILRGNQLRHLNHPAWEPLKLLFSLCLIPWQLLRRH